MPSYQLKRTYQVGYMPPTKRSRSYKVATRALVLNKPEVKDIVINQPTKQVDNNDIFSNNILNLIEQGVSGSNRIGDKIRVLSIEVTGRLTGDAASGTVIMHVPNQAQRVPLLTDFSTSVGTLMDLSHGWVLGTFTRDPLQKQIGKLIYKFPKGMVVHYDRNTESSTVIKNAVLLTHPNTTGSNLTNINYSVRIRYTDA